MKKNQVTKADLINVVAAKAGITKKDADIALNAVLDSITETLAGGTKVQLVGFGTFEVRERQAREGMNPQTREKIQISASSVPTFKAGSNLKEAVAAGRAD